MYCDQCRKIKQAKALINLPEVINSLTKKNKTNMEKKKRKIGFIVRKLRKENKGKSFTVLLPNNKIKIFK